jgi:hypothetical protein
MSVRGLALLEDLCRDCVHRLALVGMSSHVAWIIPMIATSTECVCIAHVYFPCSNEEQDASWQDAVPFLNECTPVICTTLFPIYSASRAQCRSLCSTLTNRIFCAHTRASRLKLMVFESHSFNCEFHLPMIEALASTTTSIVTHLELATYCSIEYDSRRFLTYLPRHLLILETSLPPRSLAHTAQRNENHIKSHSDCEPIQASNAPR